MISRKELLKSKEYWMVRIQSDLFSQFQRYMNNEGLNRTGLAEKLGVSKGYVSQILNGDYDHRLSKFVELSLSIGKVPVINYMDLDKFIIEDELWESDYKSDEVYSHVNFKIKPQAEESISLDKKAEFEIPEEKFEELNCF